MVRDEDALVEPHNQHTGVPLRPGVSSVRAERARSGRVCVGGGGCACGVGGGRGGSTHGEWVGAGVVVREIKYGARGQAGAGTGARGRAGRVGHLLGVDLAISSTNEHVLDTSNGHSRLSHIRLLAARELRRDRRHLGDLRLRARMGQECVRCRLRYTRSFMRGGLPRSQGSRPTGIPGGRKCQLLAPYRR